MCTNTTVPLYRCNTLSLLLLTSSKINSSFRVWLSAEDASTVALRFRTTHSSANGCNNDRKSPTLRPVQILPRWVGVNPRVSFQVWTPAGAHFTALALLGSFFYYPASSRRSISALLAKCPVKFVRVANRKPQPKQPDTKVRRNLECRAAAIILWKGGPWYYGRGKKIRYAICAATAPAQCSVSPSTQGHTPCPPLTPPPKCLSDDQKRNWLWCRDVSYVVYTQTRVYGGTLLPARKLCPLD